MRSHATLRLLLKPALLLLALALLLLVPASAGAGTSLNAKELTLIRAIDQSYAYDLTSRLSTMPFARQGEVVSGTADDATIAAYLKNEMQTLGLAGLTVDSFDLTGWNFNAALVEVTSPVAKQLTHVRSIDGCPATPNGQPVSGQLVDAGKGRVQDFAAISGGVQGKIVLIERSMDMFYGVPALREAKQQGAAAALLYTPVDTASLNQDCAHADIPGLYITGDDAAYLRGQLAGGAVQVSVTSNVTIDESAKGHVVYGMIQGSTWPDEYVVLEAHFDHWWDGANDDNSGIASSLAVAKAVLDGKLKPKRSLLFMFFSGHESAAGGSKDSHWDWATGPYFYFKDHPEWLPKIVEALCADGVGGKSDMLAVETTPDLAGVLTKAAADAQIDYLITPTVFTPVSSFDSWSFYWHGTPAATTYQFELNSILDLLGYHRDAAGGIGGLSEIRPEFLAADARFRGLAAWRIAQAGVLPNKLTAESQEARSGLVGLLKAVPNAKAGALKRTLGKYQSRAAAFEARVKNLRHPSAAKLAAMNARRLRVLSTVSPYLWDQDLGLYNAEPGWNSVTKYDQYANDIPKVEAAIKALRKGDGAKALESLAGVVTMSWGKDVSAAGYESTLGIFYSTPNLNWATGHMPWLTNVKPEYDAVAQKVAARAAKPDYSQEIASLRAKLAQTYKKMNAKIAEVTAAFAKGSKLLK